MKFQFALPRRLLVAGALSLALTGGALAWEPTKPINLVVGFSAGGGTDLIARYLANASVGIVSQPIIVVNRTGAGGAIAAASVASAEPDGHTLLIGGGSESTTIPLFSNVSFNLKSFRPIVNLIRLRLIMVASTEAPFKTLPEYVAYAKANPGKVNFATSGPAALNAAVLLLLNRSGGITATPVPFRGDADAIVALLSGQIHAAAVSADQAQAHVDAGRLRYLAVASNDRVPALPAVPTFKELGYNVVVENMKGVVGPAGISDDIYKYYESRFRKAVETDVYKAAVTKGQFETSFMDGPEFGRAMQRVSDDIAAAIPR